MSILSCDGIFLYAGLYKNRCSSRSNEAYVLVKHGERVESIYTYVLFLYYFEVVFTYSA